MNNTRRSFLKTSSAGAVSLTLIPTITKLNGLFDSHLSTQFPRVTPESQGISSQALLNFVKEANASGVWHSFMLLRHGNVVAEGWWKPFEENFKHTMYSLSKSFTSTAIGLLVKEGKLDINAPLISFFPGELPSSVSENLKKVRIKHVLTMNTGHAEDTMPKMRDAKDSTWIKAYLELPVKFEPGSHFLYNTGNTYMLGAIIYQITGKNLETYLGPRLFQPLEIKGYDWEKSPQGLNTGGYGLRIKTEDIAKLGQLYLQKGKWKGKQILTEEWVNEATSSQTRSQENNGDWSVGYGYQFWRCTPGFYRGDGAFGQFCIVMPEHDVVLAVTSESWNMQQSMNTVWEKLLPAIKGNTVAGDPVALLALRTTLQGLSLPVPKGNTDSPLVKKYHGKKISLADNAFGAKETSFHFSKVGCTWKIRTVSGEKSIRFGWENWVVSKDSMEYPFAVPGRINVPSKIAGTATWIEPNTLQLNARFVEAIHADKITCRFDDQKVTISLLVSTSENVKNNPEKREPLSGFLR